MLRGQRAIQETWRRSWVYGICPGHCPLGYCFGSKGSTQVGGCFFLVPCQEQMEVKAKFTHKEGEQQKELEVIAALLSAWNIRVSQRRSSQYTSGNSKVKWLQPFDSLKKTQGWTVLSDEDGGTMTSIFPPF